MAGLLSRFKPSPLSMGLLNAGANMMIAGGPSRMPNNLGTSLGAGLQGLLQGYSIENESQQDREYQNAMLERQMQNDAIEMQIKQSQLDNVNNPRATPGQWYIPPGAEPFSDPTTGFVGYKTKEGGLFPSRFAMTEYQSKITDPKSVGSVAAAREGEKVRDIRVGPEGEQQFSRTADLMNIMPNLIQAESSGNPNAVSPKGAQGLTQLMPGTAMQYGGKTGAEMPPSEQILTGAKVLSDYVKRQGEDYKKGLAAYNAGPGNVAKNGVAPYQGYVDKVLGAKPQTMKEKADVDIFKAGKEAEIKNRAENDKILMEKKRSANDVLVALQQAAPLVSQSTASGMGNIVDQAAGFIGKSTKGAEAADQLKVLGESITLRMPKPTGPQSDADMRRAEKASAQIQDPTIPTERKQAAMQTLADYLSTNAGLPPVKLNFTGGEIGGGDMSDDELDARLEKLMKGKK